MNRFKVDLSQVDFRDFLQIFEILQEKRSEITMNVTSKVCSSKVVHSNSCKGSLFEARGAKNESSEPVLRIFR